MNDERRKTCSSCGEIDRRLMATGLPEDGWRGDICPVCQWVDDGSAPASRARYVADPVALRELAARLSSGDRERRAMAAAMRAEAYRLDHNAPDELNVGQKLGGAA